MSGCPVCRLPALPGDESGSHKASCPHHDPATCAQCQEIGDQPTVIEDNSRLKHRARPMVFLHEPPRIEAAMKPHPQEPQEPLRRAEGADVVRVVLNHLGQFTSAEIERIAAYFRPSNP